MVRAPEQKGDKLQVGTVAGASYKSYPLAPIPQNVTYETISTQPEAELNQPVTVPISFHGGLAYDRYDERTGGCLVNTGILCNEVGVLRAPVKVNTVTLTDAAAPPMYFFETGAPNATVTTDTGNASSNTQASATTNSWSHTVAAGTGRILIVGVASDGTDVSPTSVTFGSQSLAMAVDRQESAANASLWYIVAPTVATDTVTVTFAASRNSVAGAVVLTGVNQSAPLGTAVSAGATNDAGPATDASASATGEIVIDVVAVENVTATDDETQQIWQDIEGTAVRGACSYEAGAASVTTSWTLGAASDWVICAVPVKPASTPVLYANSVEAGEVNAYKVSMDNANFGTLLNTKTWSGVTTPPMGRPAEWTSGGSTVWLMPLGDNILIDSLTTVAASTSADTWSGGTDAYARHLLVVKNQLYRLEGANVIGLLANNTDPETDANWTGDHPVGDVGYKVTDLAQVAGQAMVPKEDGLWEFDGVASATNVLPELGIAERNGQGLSYGRGGFFVPGVAGLYWTRTGEPIGPESHDDTHTANDPSIGAGEYFKHGRWQGTANYNGHFYGLYVNSAGTTGFVVWGYPVNQQWRWHVLASVTADFDDFHGVYVSETSKFSASEVRPCLWLANGNDLSYIWLDKNGAPMLRRGDVDVATDATVTSGRVDSGYPRVLKQLSYVSGWAEDMVTDDKFTLKVYRDGGTVETVAGGTISTDGYFTRYWAQDVNDTCRSLLFSVVWAASGDTTDLNGPHMRDLQIHAILLPTTTREWSILIYAEDNQGKTAKTIRSELEAYIGDLKKFKVPFEDAFNGVITGLTLLKADEVRDLTPRMQEPPSYVFRAMVREMPAS